MTDKEVNKIRVKLSGTNGNAFAILGKVQRALKRAGQPDLADEYMRVATRGDYDHLIATTMKYVEVE